MKILPIHPRPRHDELLSSWITRLAIENGFYPYSFFTKVVGLKGELIVKDVDRGNFTGFLERLSQVSGVSTEELSNLCISSLQGEVFSHESLVACVRWVLPLGCHKKIKRSKGIVYCPLCLKEDEVRYFRKSWRLAFMTLCEKHGCVLWDHCYYCKASINYQRVGIRTGEYEIPNKDLGICFNCRKPLWEAPVKTLSLSLERFSSPYRNFLSAYASGNPIVPELNQPLNIQVLNGLWLLSGRLAGERAIEVRERILKETGIAISSLKQNCSFEAFPFRQRLNILIAVLYYLQDWPNKFLDLVKNTTFTVSSFKKGTGEMPFWLRTVVYEHLNAKPRAMSDEEIMTGIKYLQKKNPSFSMSELARLLGVDVGGVILRLKNIKRK